MATPRKTAALWTSIHTPARPDEHVVEIRHCSQEAGRGVGVVGTVHSGYCFFFFQAEDGIRDATVTGVQTCALPIMIRHTRCYRDWSSDVCSSDHGIRDATVTGVQTCALPIDRKSTRLNSSHGSISYAVFC